MANAPAISGNESGQELQAKIDSGDTFTLDSKAVSRFIARFVEGQLTVEQFEQIGDLLESAEFFEYVGPGADGLIAQVVFEFSTPHSKGKITREMAERWLSLLS